MDKSEWQGQTGQTWSQNWRRTDRSFAVLTERLLACLRGQHIAQLLDIGCGAGELSLAIARGHPDTQICGVDISDQLVEAARGRAANFSNVSFECADAASWLPGDEFAPDMLVSRHGVMFFDDPAGAFANLANISRDNARLIFSCFRAPGENPFLGEVAQLLPPPSQTPDPHAPGPFAFADKERVTGILQKAGWNRAVFEPFDFPMVAGAGENPVEEAVKFFSLIGPAARAIAELDEAGREPILQKLRKLAEKNCRDGIVSLPAAAWIVTAHKA